MKGYQKLQVYQLAHELAIRIHAISMSLPQFERYEEGSQIRRFSKSVSVNIVEEFALRKYKNEYLHFLYRSYGSGEETLEHLRYLFATRSLKDRNVYEDFENAYQKLNGMLFNFIMSIEKTFDKPAFLFNLKRDT